MLLLRWLQGIRSLVRPHHLWSPKRVLWSATLPSSTYSFGTYSLIFVFCISSFISQESLCTTRQTSPRASSTGETITTLHYHCLFAFVSPTRHCALGLAAMSWHLLSTCQCATHGQTSLIICRVSMPSIHRTIISHMCLVSNGLPSTFLKIPTLNYRILGRNLGKISPNLYFTD